jgi:two-component system LytT family response regulator
VRHPDLAETPVRVVIADDEPLARQRVRSMLVGRPEYVIVGEAANGAEAVELILHEQPDVVFLDIKMPELDGFEVVEALEAVPELASLAIVFVTAFGEYAVKAFEVRALDYLLKPFDRARFDRALESAAARRRRQEPEGNAGIDPGLREMLEQLRPARRYAARFLVRSTNHMYFVRVDDVDWMDAAGNYVRLHSAGRAHLVRDTMKALEGRLDPERFVRIHRSAIVNIERVAQIEPYLHGEYVVTLRDGTKLTSSRAHSANLRALLGQQ